MHSGALKTASGLWLSGIEVGNFFGESRLKDGRLLFIFRDFCIEFIEGFAAGCKD